MRPFLEASILTLARALPIFSLMSTAPIEAAESANSTGNSPLIVTASRIPGGMDEVSSSITVIDRARIEAAGAANIIDLMRHVPGLHIDQSGGRGGVSAVYIRGSDPNFTVVLIDGVRVNDPTNSRGGSFDLSTVDLAAVERIEIVRGPLSALYGSDAMAGVINIITRSGESKFDASATLGVGPHEARQATAQISGPSAAGAYAVTASYVNDGHLVPGDRFINRAAALRLNMEPSDSSSVQIASRVSNSFSAAFPEDSGGSRYAVMDDVDVREKDEASLGLTYTRSSRAIEYRLQGGYYDHKEDVWSPGVAPGTRDPAGIPMNSIDSQFKRWNVLVSGLYQGNSFDITLGMEIQWEKGESVSKLFFDTFTLPGDFHDSRRLVSPFVETRVLAGDKWIIDAAVRVDDPDSRDEETTSRIGIHHALTANTSLRAQWGQGFKLPSFFALSHPLVGNPNLLPETSESYDLGFDQKLIGDRLRLSGAYFHNQFENLVDFDEGPPPRLVNRSKVRTEGFEVSFDLVVDPAWKFQAMSTYTDSDILDSREALRNRPKWRNALSMDWRARPTLTVNARTTYTGESLDSSIPTGDVMLDGYTRTDVALLWRASNHARLSFALDNVFDKNYEEKAGFPAPGLVMRFGATVEL